MGLLDTWDRDLAQAREREGDGFRNPLRPRLTSPPDPRLLKAVEECAGAGFLPELLSKSAIACRLWRDRCAALAIPDARIARTPAAATAVVSIDFRPLAEPPAVEVIERVAARLRERAITRGRLSKSDVMIVGSRIPPDDAPAVVAECLAILRSSRPPGPATEGQADV